MGEPLPQADSVTPGRWSAILNPANYWRKRREERIRRERAELSGYLEAAIPLILQSGRLYEEWRESVSEPIRNGQIAANLSAGYWWRITDTLRKFEEISAPKPAQRHHKLFVDVLRNASEGAEVVKNGFRFNKYVEISRGMGFLDRYVELAAEAEVELGRLREVYGLPAR